MDKCRERVVLNEGFAGEFDQEARVVSANVVYDILDELESVQDECMDIWFKAYILSNKR